MGTRQRRVKTLGRQRGNPTVEYGPREETTTGGEKKVKMGLGVEARNVGVSPRSRGRRFVILVGSRSAVIGASSKLVL